MAKVDTSGNPAPLANSLSALIPGVLGPRQGTAKKTKNKDKASPVKEEAKTSFSRLLEKPGAAAEPRELPPSEEAVQELLDGVHAAGDNLKNRPFPEEIKAYKKAVRNFLHHVVSYGFTTEIQAGIPRYLKPGFKGDRRNPDSLDRAKFVQIEVVDRKLEQLAAGILSGQMSQLKLLAGIEEITGILIDLLR
ncbi:MAG: DUF327 family protein [Treponema sp.]|jgi:uncharacterized protein YaaR (DUF327 family)|nr:DUF327 family protein [Treponema sp.]